MLPLNASASQELISQHSPAQRALPVPMPADRSGSDEPVATDRRSLLARLRSGSIAVVVAVALSVAMSVLVAAAIYVAYRTEYASRVATLIDRTAVISGHMAAELQRPLAERDAQQMARVASDFLNGPTLAAVQIDSTGPLPATRAWLKDAQGHVQQLDDLPPMEGQLQHSAPVAAGTSVTIFVPIAPARIAAWESVRRELVPLALADALMILMLWVLVWYLVLRPVARLEQFARQTRLESSALQVPPAAGFHGELATLRSSMQQMVDLLQERFYALRRSQERFELAVAGSNDGIWDWDLRSDEVYYSPRLIGLLGFAEGNDFPPVAQSFWLRIHPTDYTRFSRSLSRHLRLREPFDVQFRARLADGQYRWFRGRGQAYWDEQGKALRMCGSLTDTHEQVLAQESLERTRERELRAREEFARQLLTAHEQERARIAAELHDSIGQSLSLIANRAQLALNIAQLPVSASVHIDSLVEVTAGAIADVRALVQNLRPLHIDQIGLTASLEGLIERWSSSAAVKVDQRLENVDTQLTGSDATHVYRIAQEALNNVQKHAAARCVNVQLENDLHCVRLVVIDDGRGFDPGSGGGRGSGYGLTTMLERTKMLGGTLAIVSSPGSGTRLTVELPVAENLYIDPVESQVLE